jgi:GntR family transcriptional regulator, arabinose operon transcriptional repressor
MTTTNDNQMMSAAQQLARRLREEIRRGTYVLGARMPTERELGNRYRLSRGTVREALNLLEAERLVLRQQGRGTFVADPAFARQGKGKAALLGMMVYEREYYFEKVVQGAAAQAGKRGYALATGSNADPVQELEHTTAYLRNGVLGVALSPLYNQSDENYQRLVDQRIPVVLMDTLIPGRDEDYVGADNARGTWLAVAHLYELGHRRIAYLGHNRVSDPPCRPDRRRGYQEGCGAMGIPAQESWIIEAESSDMELMVARLLKSHDRPTAFVTYNDTAAIAVIKAARAVGLDVPRDLSVVGFDDSSIAAGFEIPLTSVSPEQRETGIATINLLIEKIENPRPRPKMVVMIRPRVIVRSSTAKAPV